MTTSQERSQLDGLKQVLEAFSLSEDLRWRWNEESQGTTLETSWTDIVQSHSVRALSLYIYFFFLLPTNQIKRTKQINSLAKA